jgi:DNA uptake protein ComE-like DNA-binding protein
MARHDKMQIRLWKELGLLGLATLAASVAVIWLSGCNSNQSDQQLQQQAAQTTQQVKQDAQQAAANAKVAAANAERKVDDIAAGVKQGMHSDKPAPGTAASVDINSASAARISTLPGISATRAQKIVDARPYSSPHDLVAKGLVSEAEFHRISGDIVAD